MLAIDASILSAAEGFDVFQKIRSFDGSDMHLSNSSWLSKLLGSGRRGGTRAEISFAKPATVCASNDESRQALFLSIAENKARNGQPVPSHLIMAPRERISFILDALPVGAGILLPQEIIARATSDMLNGIFIWKTYHNFQLWELASPFLAAEEEARMISTASPAPRLVASAAPRL